MRTVFSTQTSRIAPTLLATVLLASATASHAVPVESRPLSNPSAGTSTDSSAPTSQLWQLTQAVQQLQDEVRILRGKVENHDNDIDQLQKDSKNRFTDFDQRLAQVQDDVKKLQAASAPAAPTTDGQSGTAPATTGGDPNAPQAATDDADKAAYIAAYEAYKAGGAAQAIGPMQKFISDYPKSQFVPNAYYWLGEFNLAATPPNFTAAASNFKIVTSQYPKSAKAAASTYRLATLADVDQRPAQAVALMKTIIKNYPGTQEAGFATDYLKKHAGSEEKKAPVKSTEKSAEKAKPVKKKTKAASGDDDSAA